MGLHVEDFFAPFVAVGLVAGNERQRIDVAVERRGPQALGNLHFDHGVLRLGFVLAERGVAAAFEFQPSDVHVGHDELFFACEAGRFAQDRTVFGD